VLTRQAPALLSALGDGLSAHGWRAGGGALGDGGVVLGSEVEVAEALGWVGRVHPLHLQGRRKARRRGGELADWRCSYI
jgi:hypothetical protein